MTDPANPSASAPDTKPVPDPQIVAAFQNLDARTRAAEQRAAIAEDAARRAGAAAAGAIASNQPRQPDPLDRLATEDVTLLPDQRKALLGQAIEGRARAIAGQAVTQMREEAARRDASLESKIALDNVMAQRPELSDPANAGNYAMAMTKAKFELENAGVQYSAAQLAQRAAGIYDSAFRPKQNPPPHVEGASAPNFGGFPADTQFISGPTRLEKTYGMKAGQIQELFDPNDAGSVVKLNNDYTHGKNDELMKRGVVTAIQSIIKGGDLT